MKDLVLFHWSPTERRKQILRYGLMPKRKPTVNVAYEDGKPWRAPYVCLSPTPSLAWALSGSHEPRIKSWDLWQTWLNDLPENRRRVFYSHHLKEVRVFERIYKRHLWYVGTRAQ